MVYFLQCILPGDLPGPVKIGHSSRPPARRLEEVQTCCPYPLRLVLTLPGDRKLERKLHRRFAHASLHGEWFRPTGALVAWILEKRGGLPF